MAEALVRYPKFVVGYYVNPDGTPTGTADDIKITLSYLRRLFGPVPLSDFGIPEIVRLLRLTGARLSATGSEG